MTRGLGGGVPEAEESAAIVSGRVAIVPLAQANRHSKQRSKVTEGRTFEEKKYTTLI